MDINGITSANPSALPGQKLKAATGSPDTVSGNRSSNAEAISLSQGSGKADDGANEEQLKKAVESANKLMELLNSHLDFSIDQATKRVVVKVINGNTNEVVRQIPSEEMLKMAAKFSEINAVLFSQKV